MIFQITAKFHVTSTLGLADVVLFIDSHYNKIVPPTGKNRLRAIEMEIFKIIDWKLFPVGGIPSERNLEFFEAWRFHARADHSTEGEPLEPRRDVPARVFSGFTVSIATMRERKIVYYWQASILLFFL